MENKRLLLFGGLALLSLFCWLAGNEVLSPDSQLLSSAMTLAYPASIIFGAGALAGIATRAPFLRAADGSVSLPRTAILVFGIFTLAALSYRYGGTLVHNFCWYISLVSSLAFVFLLIARSRSA